MISLAGNRTSGKDVSGKYPFRKISIQVIESRKKYIRPENRTTVTEIIRTKVMEIGSVQYIALNFFAM